MDKNILAFDPHPEHERGLRQITVFSTRFLKEELWEHDGAEGVLHIIEESFYGFLKKVDGLTDEEAKKILPDFAFAETRDLEAEKKVGRIFQQDPSLRRILARKFLVAKKQGTLISDEEIIKRNLFRREKFKYIGTG